MVLTKKGKEFLKVRQKFFSFQKEFHDLIGISDMEKTHQEHSSIIKKSEENIEKLIKNW